MLEKIGINCKVENKVFNIQFEELQEKLKRLQLTTIKLDIPIILCIEGWSSSGKGTLIGNILQPLDPRFFNVYTFGKVIENEKMRPYLYAYWTRTPRKGNISIFDKSWHRSFLKEGREKWGMKDKEIKNFYRDVEKFEKQLVDDGIVIVKFFLHIDKEEQKNRFENLVANEFTRWRIDKKDLEQNKNYKESAEEFSKMLISTHFEYSPWHIIEANDMKYAIIKTYNILINIFEEAIRKKELSERKTEPQYKNSLREVKIINKTAWVTKTISKNEYNKKLEELQNKISELTFVLYKERKSVIIVYEGWDASGKGGNIKRLTQKIDPRGYNVNSVPAPTKEELDHHYLWRFWKNIPKDGHIAIFDRSWYGRVLVEKVEGFCTREEGERAYKEINDIEENISNHGTIIYKVFINISKDEQFKRFQARQTDELKRYKITDEDWRNRDKWDEYEIAIDEMIEKTSTEHAPWLIVEGNDKKYARIKVLQHIVEDLEKRTNTLVK